MVRAAGSVMLQFPVVPVDDGSVEPTDLAALYRELQPGLLRYLRSVAPASSEDLAADVWVEVLACLPRFHGDQAAFRSWLYTIARRRVIDGHRRACRRRTDPVDRDRLDGEPCADHPDETALDRLATAAVVARVAAALTPDQAEVVLLRVVGGLQVSQVAELMGKRPGTVRVLQHRGLRRLSALATVERLIA
ncbi:MAG: polymerase sigma-70 factor, subfamily [Actinomycetota bacterium]|nr:polymerase sigma-70 factor, subfamily [Actinomycetota bacterium]MEA2844423.1 polymerase sigma-70 factor, subfamily [Actinomycetota bacterium]